jgi:hypothetical protein
LKVQLGTATRFDEEIPIVSMYPNSVSNELKINMGSFNETVTATVTDMYGRKIETKTFSNVSIINTSRFAPGVYLITIIDKNGMMIKQNKIVKE